MHRRTAFRTALAVAVLTLAGAAGVLVAHASAAPSSPSAAGKQVAGTLDTQLSLSRFTASGRRLVGHGTVVSTLRNAAGTTLSTSRKPFKAALVAAAGPGPCQVLYLELDELDLTLLGLRVWLRSATPDEPIRLTLSADSTHGILGKLFCDLAGSTITTPKLKTAAKQLNKRVRTSTLLRAKATLYQPERRTSGTRSPQQATANCQVLHLILGPLHLDLLGLIVDLNKVALDIESIPGTTIGDVFCSLVGGPPSTTTSTTATTTTAATTTTVP